MKTKEFNAVVQSIDKCPTREAQEEYINCISYMGYFFLNLTSRQNNAWINHLTSRHLVEVLYNADGSQRGIKYPNGLVQTYCFEIN